MPLSRTGSAGWHELAPCSQGQTKDKQLCLAASRSFVQGVVSLTSVCPIAQHKRHVCAIAFGTYYSLLDITKRVLVRGCHGLKLIRRWMCYTRQRCKCYF